MLIRSHVGTPYPFVDSDSSWQQFWIGVNSGSHHILGGLDHLMFLFLLLLSAPLLINNREWGNRKSWLDTLRSALKTISAFTLGHTTSLILTALGIIHLPARPTESIIALSIAIMAINILIPIGRSSSLLLPLLFGTIHGLAFAQSLSQLVIFKANRILALFSFNLGIELVQAILTLLLLPLIWRATGSIRWPKWRIALGLIAFVMAELWLGERLFNFHAPL